MEQDWLRFSDEVADARAQGLPLVALESTIISHGMPYPDNLTTANALEDEVRRVGAVPATIALMDGHIQVGLNKGQLEQLATSKEVTKVSRRDLPLVIARQGMGATTVAATMICAHMAGIRVFATGGIGGVHRGGENSMDVSADLTELARTSVAVVCAGAKAILDLGRTLEYLETHGVPVLGYRTDRFPAFYTRDSGFGLDARLDEADEIARVLATKWQLGLEGGVVIANPVPEAQELKGAAIETAMNQALAEAESQAISGKRVTPFLLERVKQLTDGESLRTNVALVRNNACLAGKLAVALNRCKAGKT